MSNIKRKWRFFSIPEYEEEQEWLMKQHKAGWKLINASLPGIYKFEKCRPEEVVYQLDYNQEGMENKNEYVKMFEDCGWEYITDMVGYSYFRKPVSQMNDKEEIFSDDASKMDMIERVFKGKMILLICIFIMIIIPQLTTRLHHEIPLGKVVFGIYLFLFVMYIIIFIKFAIQYARLKKRLRR